MKISRIKQKAKHLICYSCPNNNCKGILALSLKTVLASYDWWVCEKCKKTFELCFKEAKQ